MANEKFLGGVVVGIVAGIAAKFVYDNKEEIADIAVDNYYSAKDQAVTIVEHSKDKAASAKEYAKDQVGGIKERIFSADDDELDISDDDVEFDGFEDVEVDDDAVLEEAEEEEEELEKAAAEEKAEEEGENLDEFKLDNGLI